VHGYASQITNPFEDMSVGLGEHSVFDDKFSFGEDPHTEFNQLDDMVRLHAFTIPRLGIIALAFGHI
jgi:hypothetical protein